MREIQAYQRVARQQQQDQLILSHLNLVRHVVGRLAAELPVGVDLENLEAAGALGLVEAANSFDSERGVQFKSFAYHRIRGAVLDELRRNSPLPQQMLERVQRVRQVYQNLAPPVTVEKLAEETGLSDDEVADCLAAMRLVQMGSVEEISRTVGDPRDPHEALPSAGLEREEEARLLAQAIEGLPSQQRLVVTLYYSEDLRLKEISAVMRLSESRISRLLNAALFTLRERLRARFGDTSA